MKIRNGFVTNSSSSSFILAFNKTGRWTSYGHFKASCERADYNEFFDLIDDISSDYLVLSNDSDKTLSVRLLIDKIKDVDFGCMANDKLSELYEKDYQLEPYEYYCVKINDLKNYEINLDEIDFEDICEDDYSIDLVEHSDNRSKEKALELLYNYYSYDYRLELLDKLLNREDYKTTHDYYIAKIELEKSKEFKEMLNTYVNQNKEYFYKKDQIEEADFVVQGTVWDTDGGLLEWSIRNGFIEENFRRNHVITWNVG